MCADLLDVQKVSKRRLPLRFHLSKVHGGREVVDEAAVDVQHAGFAEGTHEHVSNLLVTVPVSDGLGEGDPKEGVTLEDVGNTVEEHRDFRAIQDRRTCIVEGFFVILAEREQKRGVSFATDKGSFALTHFD